jgi:putative toxin-antitoxin system antitoxin component (TIGR02293 family)
VNVKFPVKPSYSVPGGDENAFAQLMDEFGAARERAVGAIRTGFPVTVLQDAGKYFDVPVAQIRKIVGVANTTAHTWARQKTNMDSAASERIWRMADISTMAIEIFGGEPNAKRWLTTPNRALHGSSPLEFLDTEPGAIAVRQILNAIATGGAV